MFVKSINIFLFVCIFYSGMRVDIHDEKREPTPVFQNDAIINIHTPPVNGKIRVLQQYTGHII